jgi:hypothetical protein
MNRPRRIRKRGAVHHTISRVHAYTETMFNNVQGLLRENSTYSESGTVKGYKVLKVDEQRSVAFFFLSYFCASLRGYLYPKV